MLNRNLCSRSEQYIHSSALQTSSSAFRKKALGIKSFDKVIFIFKISRILYMGSTIGFKTKGNYQKTFSPNFFVYIAFYSVLFSASS